MAESRRTCYASGYELLREERERRGWTLTEMEARSGVTYSRISRIERGEGGDEDTWAALCKPLGLRFVRAHIRKESFSG